MTYRKIGKTHYRPRKKRKSVGRPRKKKRAVGSTRKRSRRRKVSGLSTGAAVALGLGALALLYLAMQGSSTAQPKTIVVASPGSGSSSTVSQNALTAAEIAAGAGIVTTALNDFSS